MYAYLTPVSLWLYVSSGKGPPAIRIGTHAPWSEYGGVWYYGTGKGEYPTVSRLDDEDMKIVEAVCSGDTPVEVLMDRLIELGLPGAFEVAEASTRKEEVTT